MINNHPTAGAPTTPKFVHCAPAPHMKKPQVKFRLVSLRKIPVRLPATPLTSKLSGSKWDDAFEAVKRRGARQGIRVRAKTQAERQRMKSSLQTVAKTRAMRVMVLNDETSLDFFAWLSDRPGRFAGPG